MGEVGKCTRCEHLDTLNKEKDDEIQKLKQKIHNLKNFFRTYSQKSKLHQCCHGSSNNSAHTHNFCHEEPKICVSVQVNGKFSYSGSISTQKDENNPEYVYDETLKMHYCISTGYYYDTKSGLFYIPENDAYYKFDYNKNEYEFVKSGTQTSNEDAVENCESVVDRVSSLNLKDLEESSDLNSSSNQEFSHFDESFNYQEDDISEEMKEKIKQEIVETNESSTDWQPPEGSNATVGDLVREVAEQNSGMSDYIYDEKSQMYYSKLTGYFYDPIRKLLYDPKHKVFYLYDQEKMSYDFYCHADSMDRPSPCEVPTEATISKSNQARKEQKIKKKKKSIKQNLRYKEVKEISPVFEDSASSAEDGEVFSSDSDSSQNVENEIEQDPTSRLPCIRAIVESSHRIKNGTLVLITCTGGVVGRGKPSAIHVPDISVSKAHAVVKFCYESKVFSIEDLGSQNGTFVNDTRLSKPKQKSQPCNLKHGDKLCLGSCKLLIHIHDGHDTCDKCEPGQVMAELSLQEEKVTSAMKSKEEKEKERRNVLKSMKKKYGLGGMNYPSDKSTSSTVSLGYEDKAEIRRKTVGSENPYEKTQSSSLDQCVPKSSKGYQMLKSLGWKEGESLGVSGLGIAEPIPIRPWFSRAGLGCSEAEASCPPPQVDKRQQKWVKAQERYYATFSTAD